MTVVCDTCGKSFDKTPTKIKPRNYCSRKCLGEANRERLKKNHMMVCDFCGRTFEQKSRHATRNKHFYCSKECGWAAKGRRETVICNWCGLPFQKKRSDVSRSQYNLCDRDCYQDFINFGMSGTPNQRVGGKVLYRALAEMKLGRELTESEEVHHIDGNHNNNAPDNLMVLSRSEHMSIHAAIKKRGANGKFVNKG